MIRTHRNRPLVFESLDQRLPLAGNVTAAVSGGMLQITGEYLDNAVAVWSGASAGQVTVAGASQTKVNGTLSNKSFSGVNSIKFSMAGGNDQVLMTKLNLAGGVTFGSGNGDDRLVLRGLGSAAFPPPNQGAYPYGAVSIGSLDFFGSGGKDTLEVVSASVPGRLNFYGGTGDDRVTVTGNKSANVFGSLSLHMEQGNDQILIQSAQVTNPTSQVVAVGIDDSKTSGDAGTSAKAELYNVDVTGRTFVTLSGYQAMFGRLGGGSATTGFSSTDNIVISGNDVAAKYTTSPSLEVNGSSTLSNQVRISDSQFTDLKVTMGSARDTLTVANLTTTHSAVFNGGSGRDTYERSGANNLQGLQLLSFEILPFGGPVTSSLASGELTLTGSFEREVMVVSSGANPGEVIVYGAKGTKIDGQDSKTFSGITKLSIKLLEANDRVLVTNWNSNVSLSFVGGEGDDQLVVTDAAPAAGFPTLNQGSIQYGPVSGRGLGFSEENSRGVDTLQIFNAAFSDGVVAVLYNSDRIEVDGDINKNRFGGGFEHRALWITGWAYTSSVKNAHLTGLYLESKNLLDDQVLENLEVDGDFAAYAPHLTLRNVTVTGAMLVFSLANYQVRGFQLLEHVTAPTLNMRTNDELFLRDSEFDDMRIYAISGDDTFTIGSTITHNSTSLDGGDGFDRFVDEGGNDFANLEFKNFEAFG